RSSRVLESMRPLAWLVEPPAWRERERRAAVGARPVGVLERGQIWVLETAQVEAPPAAALGPPSAQAGPAALMGWRRGPSALQPEVKREPKPDLTACRLARATRERRPQGAAAQGSARRPECLRAASGFAEGPPDRRARDRPAPGR